MPFDPAKPATGSQISSAELRSQLTGLQDQLIALFNQTSANTNSVAPLGLSISDPPTQSDVQQLASKLDELINALRR